MQTKLVARQKIQDSAGGGESSADHFAGFSGTNFGTLP
jgi:hypothetical protein